MNNMDSQILEKIGLSPSEAKSYVACFELGEASAADVANRASLNRSNCYEALKRLIAKGLISVIKVERKTLFKASDTKQLYELVENNKEQLSLFINDLDKRRNSKNQQSTATLFEGYNGIKAVFEDILNTLKKGEEYLVFGAVDVPEVFGRYISHWTKNRIKKGIKLKIIFNKEAYRLIQASNKISLSEIKILPKEYITPAVVNIYGDKTATIVWGDKPVAFVVENKEYAKSFRNYFELLWKLAKK